MYADKSNLLERINIAINKKWSKKNIDTSDSSWKQESREGFLDRSEKNNLAENKNSQSIESLEKRIVALEKQQYQILYFINFLVENLPGLVINIVKANKFHITESEQKAVIDETIEKWLNEKTVPAKGNPSPTRREIDVLDLLEKGFCAKEIADKLFISESTVITHKKNLKEKFHAKNTVELVSKVRSQL
jgi:DNA-binding CsgD family transcriptional regulator